MEDPFSELLLAIDIAQQQVTDPPEGGSTNPNQLQRAALPSDQSEACTRSNNQSQINQTRSDTSGDKMVEEKLKDGCPQDECNLYPKVACEQSVKTKDTPVDTVLKEDVGYANGKISDQKQLLTDSSVADIKTSSILQANDRTLVNSNHQKAELREYLPQAQSATLNADGAIGDIPSSEAISCDKGGKSVLKEGRFQVSPAKWDKSNQSASIPNSGGETGVNTQIISTVDGSATIAQVDKTKSGPSLEKSIAETQDHINRVSHRDPEPRDVQDCQEQQVVRVSSDNGTGPDQNQTAKNAKSVACAQKMPSSPIIVNTLSKQTDPTVLEASRKEKSVAPVSKDAEADAANSEEEEAMFTIENRPDDEDFGDCQMAVDDMIHSMDTDDGQGDVTDVNKVTNNTHLAKPNLKKGESVKLANDSVKPSRESKDSGKSIRETQHSSIVDLTQTNGNCGNLSDDSSDGELRLVIADVTSQTEEQPSPIEQLENLVKSDVRNISKHSSRSSSALADKTESDKIPVDNIISSALDILKCGGDPATLLKVVAAKQRNDASPDTGAKEGTPVQQERPHTIVEQGECETVNIGSEVEEAPVNLAIHNVRGNVTDFHVIENQSPVVPVVIQPDGLSPPRPAKQSTTGGNQKHPIGVMHDGVKDRYTKSQVTGTSQILRGMMTSKGNFSLLPSRAPGLKSGPIRRGWTPRSIRPASSQRPGHYQQRPWNPSATYNLPRVRAVRALRPSPVVVAPSGRGSTPSSPSMSLPTQTAPGVIPIAPRPKTFTLLIPTSGQGPILPVTLPKALNSLTPGPNTIPVHLQTKGQYQNATFQAPLSIASTSGSHVPVSLETSNGISILKVPSSSSSSSSASEPQVNDNWIFRGCNAVPKYCAPLPPFSLKFNTVEHHTCRVCGDTFIHRSSLMAHLSRQSVRLEFNCNFCNWSQICFNKCRLHNIYTRHVNNDCKFSILTGNCKISPLPPDMMPNAYKERLFNQHAAKLSTVYPGEASKQMDQPAEPRGSASSATEVSAKEAVEEEDLITRLQNTKLSYQCPECLATFNSKASMSKHFVPRSYRHSVQCNKCLMLLHSACAYQAHMRIHVREAPFVCPECGMEIHGERTVFMKHIKQKCVHFSRSPSFQCPLCNAGLSVPSQVHSHILSNHSEAYHKCSSCPMAFKSVPSFTEHNRTSHGGQASAKSICKCPLCDTVYNSEQQLQSHISTHVNDVKTKGKSVFKCLGCSYSNAKKHKVIVHMIRMHSTMVMTKEMCYVCGLEAQAAELQVHTYKEHPDEYPVIYRHCVEPQQENAKKASPVIIEEEEEEPDTSNTSSDDLNKSREVTTEVKVNPEVSASPEVKASLEVKASPEAKPTVKSPWECDRCVKTFDTEEVYNKHMAKHRFVERKRKAQIESLAAPSIKIKFPKVVIKKEFIKQVPGAPSPEPRHCCMECNQKYYLESELASHLSEAHHSHSHYPCHLCGLTFSLKYMLDRHVKSKHEGKAKDFNFLCSICLERNVRKGYNTRGMLVQHLAGEHKIKKQHPDFGRVVRDSNIAAKSLDIPDALPSPEKGGELQTVSPIKRLRLDGDQIFTCAKCGFHATGRGEFLSHISNHRKEKEDSALQCQECGLSFSVQKALKRHLFMVHKVRDFYKYRSDSGIDLEKPPEEVEISALIGASGRSQIVLPNGLRRVPSSTSSRESSTEKDKVPEKKSVCLECTVCYKSFPNTIALHTHMRTHGMAFIRSKRKLSIT